MLRPVAHRSESSDEVLAACRSLARRTARVLECGAIVELLSDDQAWLVQAAVDHTDMARVDACGAMLGYEPRSVRDPVFVAACTHGLVIAKRGDESTLPGVAHANAVSPAAAVAHPPPVAILRWSGRVFGLLWCIRDRTLPQFNVHDLALVTRLAEAAAAEIGRARGARAVASAEAQRLAERGARMTTVTSALSDAARVDDVIAVLTDLGAQAAFAVGAQVARASRDALTILSARGVDRSFGVAGDVIALESDHPIARAARSGEPLWLASGEAVARHFPAIDGLAAATTGPVAVLPMRVDERLLGVLLLRMPAATFDAQERGLLRILVRHAAHALDRAELYEGERRAVQRLEHIAAMSAALAVSTDLTSTLATIGAGFVPAVAEGMSITLSDALDRREHSAGLPVALRVRTFDLEAHGESLGTMRLHGVRLAPEVDETDALFIGELARRASLALQAARTLRGLRTAIDTREEFLSAAGHELRTPLTTLKMCLYGMRGCAPAEVCVAERQIARLELVVDQLLDVTKISAGRLSLEPEAVELDALVTEAAAQLDHVQRTSGSAIAVETRGPVVGSWDRFRIAQVVSNLLSNALKYGAGNPIEVLVEGDADSARLHVRDHGIGISIEAQPRIFDRFERAVPSREYAGFGVGRWICRQIGEAHGGAIRVTSAAGEGAEFVVTLPKKLQTEVA